ncbi:MAG: non-homologous end-joining DNA ligase [Gemmatimonadota bacterium]|jgi:bifunctional non-homologous end joining protein LigD
MSDTKEEREVFGRTIGFSNLDKILYPDAGITKGDVVEFYGRIADTMLPHVQDRFLSMHRWPDGIDGKDFYQKDTPHWFPDWIRTREVEKEGGTNCQVVVEEPATLVYLAQQACLTPHVWLSRADEPRRPDRIVFDLDPPKESWREAFDDVRRAARRLRAVLDEIGLVPFVMTSGSSGLHVHVPIRRERGFDEVKGLARDVAELLARRHPERLTTEVRKKARKGRIFLDILRNEYAQTAVAPYSLRARPGAPVATPLEWDEVSGSGMGPRRYTLENLFRRLGHKDDPWKGIGRRARSLGAPREALDRLLEEEGNR